MATGFSDPYRDVVDDRPAPLTADELDRRLAAHRRAGLAAGFVRRLAAPLAVAVTAAGAVWLAARLTGGDDAAAWWTLAAGAAVAGGLAAFGTYRGRPPLRSLAARIDTALRAGGLLMTLAELPPRDRPAAWLARLEPRRDRWADARPPVPGWSFLKTLAVPVAFAGLAATVPVAAPADDRAPVDRTVAGGRVTGELRDTLAALAAGGAADPAALARAGGELDALAAAIGAGGPTAAQWEAADALRDRLLAAAADGGAAVLSDPDLRAGAGRAAELLGDGAGLLADSGLLESDLARNAAAAVGAPDPAAFDPAMLAQLKDLTGLGTAGVAALAEGLDADQQATLAEAGASLLAGGKIGDVVENLPPELLGGVFERIGETDPALMAKLAGVTPDRPNGATTAAAGSGPAGSLVGAVGAAGAVPPALTDLAETAGDGLALPPVLATAGAAVGGVLSGQIPFLDRLTGGSSAAPGAVAPVVSGEAVAPLPTPAAKVAAGRPVPPRLRGVVRRYFSAGPAGGFAGSGRTGQTPAPPE